MVFFLFNKLLLSKRAGSLIRRISKLSLVAISVSTFAFLIVLFVMGGMNKSIEGRIVSLEPHVVIKLTENQSFINLEKHPLIQKLNNDTKESYQQYKIERHSLFESQDIIIRTMDGQFRGAIAVGYNRKSLENLNQSIKDLNSKKKVSKENVFNFKNSTDNQSEIDPISSEDSNIGHQGSDGLGYTENDTPGINEIFLGVDLARSLGVLAGDSLMILPPESLLLPPGEAPTFEKVIVKKLITTNLPDLDAQYVFYIKDLALNNLKKSLSKQVGVEVWLKDSSNAKTIKNKWLDEEDELGWNQKFGKLSLETWMDRNSALFYALKLEKIMIGVFLGLAGVIASFSILTVLALLISQKKRDIAMLKTLGLSQRKTLEIFVKMGMLLSGTGVLIGSVLGLIIGLYIESHPLQVLPDIYYDSSIPARVNIWLFFIVILVSVVISFLGSYFPAKTIDEIQPSDALRQKN